MMVTSSAINRLSAALQDDADLALAFSLAPHPALRRARELFDPSDYHTLFGLDRDELGAIVNTATRSRRRPAPPLPRSRSSPASGTDLRVTPATIERLATLLQNDPDFALAFSLAPLPALQRARALLDPADFQALLALDRDDLQTIANGGARAQADWTSSSGRGTLGGPPLVMLEGPKGPPDLSGSGGTRVIDWPWHWSNFGAGTPDLPTGPFTFVLQEPSSDGWQTVWRFSDSVSSPDQAIFSFGMDDAAFNVVASPFRLIGGADPGVDRDYDVRALFSTDADLGPSLQSTPATHQSDPSNAWWSRPMEAQLFLRDTNRILDDLFTSAYTDRDPDIWRAALTQLYEISNVRADPPAYPKAVGIPLPPVVPGVTTPEDVWRNSSGYNQVSLSPISPWDFYPAWYDVVYRTGHSDDPAVRFHWRPTIEAIRFVQNGLCQARIQYAGVLNALLQGVAATFQSICKSEGMRWLDLDNLVGFTALRHSPGDVNDSRGAFALYGTGSVETNVLGVDYLTQFEFAQVYEILLIGGLPTLIPADQYIYCDGGACSLTPFEWVEFVEPLALFTFINLPDLPSVLQYQLGTKIPSTFQNQLLAGKAGQGLDLSGYGLPGVVGWTCDPTVSTGGEQCIAERILAEVLVNAGADALGLPLGGSARSRLMAAISDPVHWSCQPAGGASGNGKCTFRLPVLRLIPDPDQLKLVFFDDLTDWDNAALALYVALQASPASLPLSARPALVALNGFSPCGVGGAETPSATTDPPSTDYWSSEPERVISHPFVVFDVVGSQLANFHCAWK